MHRAGHAPPKLHTNKKQVLYELQKQAVDRVRLLVGSRGAGAHVAKLRAKFLLCPTLLTISSIIAAASRKHLGEAFSAQTLRHSGEADLILYEKYNAVLKAVATVVNGAGLVANPQADADPEAQIAAGILAACDMLLVAVDEKIMARLPKDFVTHMAGSNAAVSKAEEDVATARKARSKAAQATVLEAKVLEPTELKALKAKGADAAVLEAKVLKVLEAKAKLHRQADTTKSEYDTAKARYYACIANNAKGLRAETESMKKMHDAKLAELEELKSRNLFTMAAENPALIQIMESKVAALKEARHSQQEQQALLDTATAALPAARLDVAGKLRVMLHEWSEVAKTQMSGRAGSKVDTLVRELWQVPSSIEGKLRAAMLGEGVFKTPVDDSRLALEEALPSILHRELAAAMDQLASACISGAYHSCSLCQDVSTAVPAGAEMEARWLQLKTWSPFEP